MPTSPPRQCPTCGARVPAGERCPTCRPAWAKRTASSSTGSTRKWRKLRAAKLNADPECETPGCLELATQVDHVVPVAEGGERYDPDNTMSLCVPHHREKTQQEARRGRERKRGESS